MQVIRVHSAGNYGKLVVETLPDAQAKAGQIRLAVNAIGVNFADCMVRQGLYASAKTYVGWPIVPGFEVAGVVDQIGDGVAGWQIGDRAIGLVLFGGYASQVVCEASRVMRYPAGWSVEQAAGFPAVFLTAWYALHRLAHVRRGETLLVHSAAGGVGQALVQLALAQGCKVLGVVGGAHKLAQVRALGCHAVVDKLAQDWRSVARDFAPAGFDVALDANGVQTLGHSYRLLAPAGRLVVYGFHTMFGRGGSGRRNWPLLAWNWLRTPRFNPMTLTTDNKSVLAFNLSFLFDKSEVLAEALAYLLPLCEAGQLQPLPTQGYALAEVGRAHRDLETGTTMGKLVLIV